MTIGLSKLLVNCFAQSSVNFNLNANTVSVGGSGGCMEAELFWLKMRKRKGIFAKGVL